MQALLVIAPLVLLLFFLAGMARKNSRKSESKLSVLEHPSTFKRPDIEWVTEGTEVINNQSKGLSMDINTSQGKEHDNH